jgi:hypothetical protein
MNDARVIDVGAAIETQSGTPFSRLILILCCAAMVIEGYDVQVLAYAAPAIIRDWKVEQALFGPRGIGTLSVYGRAVIDRALGDHCWKLCPMVFRRPGITQRRAHRIHNHLLLFRAEIALADTDAAGGRWRFAGCTGGLSGGAP